MIYDSETDRENAIWRISQNGPGAEFVRRCQLKMLKEDLDAFFSHITTEDIIGLRTALKLREQADGPIRRATLLEAFAKMLKEEPELF